MKMRDHFAHQADAQCNPESVLHKIAKMLLCTQIENVLSAGRQIPLTWKCSRCSDEHKGNLLRKARTVRLEYSLPDCRPDLTLLDQHDKPVAVIEIVVCTLRKSTSVSSVRVRTLACGRIPHQNQ